MTTDSSQDELDTLRQWVAELEQANDYHNADIIRYKNELQAANARADAAEKRVRELENAANLATQYLAGSDEHEAIAVLDRVLSAQAQP